MSALRRKLKGKKPPAGWELIEEVIEDFEQQLKEAVNEEHEGKRKAEMGWKIHRIHWEKNRFIYDLMYQRKVMSKELVSGVRCSPCLPHQHCGNAPAGCLVRICWLPLAPWTCTS